MFKPFISQKFWAKLKYVEDLGDIYKWIDKEVLHFPEFVTKLR